MTKREGRSAANDPGIAALLDTDADVITLVAKAWDYHVRVALGISLDENLDGITQSIAACVLKMKKAGKDLTARNDRGQAEGRGYRSE